jgi:amidase
MFGELPFSDLAAAASALRRRRVSSAELTALVLRRIEQLNPRVAAITDVLRESARREAARADQLSKDGRAPGPISGIPIAIKT